MPSNKAAIASGAKDNISPRGSTGVLSWLLRSDPDGYSFEVVHKS